MNGLSISRSRSSFQRCFRARIELGNDRTNEEEEEKTECVVSYDRELAVFCLFSLSLLCQSTECCLLLGAACVVDDRQRTYTYA